MWSAMLKWCFGCSDRLFDVSQKKVSELQFITLEARYTYLQIQAELSPINNIRTQYVMTIVMQIYLF